MLNRKKHLISSPYIPARIGRGFTGRLLNAFFLTLSIYLTGCASQPSDGLQQELKGLTQQMMALEIQSDRITLQNSLNSRSHQGAYLLVGAGPVKLESQAGTLVLDLSLAQNGYYHLRLSAAQGKMLPPLTGELTWGPQARHPETETGHRLFNLPAPRRSLMMTLPAQQFPYRGFIRVHGIRTSSLAVRNTLTK